MIGRAGLLAMLCLAAIVARLALSYLLPNVVHADETIQYLEQAYRLVTGHGLVPWEYRIGARSWLLAGAIAPILAFAVQVSTDPAVWQGCVTAVMSGLAGWISGARLREAM